MRPWRDLVARSRGGVMARSWRGERAVLAGRAGLHRETGQARGGRRIRAARPYCRRRQRKGAAAGTHALARGAPEWRHCLPPLAQQRGAWRDAAEIRRGADMRARGTCHRGCMAAMGWRRSHLRCGGVVIEFALNMLYEKVSTRGRVAESGSGPIQGLRRYLGACEGAAFSATRDVEIS